MASWPATGRHARPIAGREALPPPCRAGRAAAARCRSGPTSRTAAGPRSIGRRSRSSCVSPSGSHGRAGILERRAEREVRRHRREQVAAVEGGRHRLERGTGSRAMSTAALDAAAAPRAAGHSRPLSGPTSRRRRAAQRQRAAVGPDARVDDGEVDAVAAGRAARSRSTSAPARTSSAGTSVRHVDHARAGRDPLRSRRGRRRRTRRDARSRTGR